jgi:3'(2'), 5'-bisphosphate nucleotidase
MILSDRGKLFAEINAIADLAGEEIMQFYRGEMHVQRKADNSPVTAADEAAERIIIAGLQRLTPNIPVVAEEEAAKGKTIKVGTQPFWLVDPLDGTKEFIAHRDQFTVNIALIEDFSPTMGIVLAPALRTSYATDGQGTVVKRVDKNPPEPISARPIPEKNVIVTASRSHGDRTKMQELIKDYAISNVLISGSSIKFCMIASGEADIYPRYGPTSEWDIAAGHAVLKAAGGSVKTLDGKEIRYRKSDFRNPEFVAYGNQGDT